MPAAIGSTCFNRRRFLQSATAMAVAATTHATTANAETPQTQSEPPIGCMLGFSTYGTKSLKTEDAITLLAEIGFDALEIAVRRDWDTDSAKTPTARRAALKQLIQQSPLRLTSLMEHVDPMSIDSQKDALERLQLACEMAHALSPENPPIVQTVLGRGDFERDKGMLRDRLAQWLAIGESTETTIAIKPHRGGGVVSQPSEAAWLFEQLGEPDRLKMVYDYSHYAFRDLTIEDTVRVAMPHTVHVAVKDAVQQGDRVVFKLPGETGAIDFVELISTMYASGYRGDFNCEVSGMVSGAPDYDPAQAAKTSYRQMAQAFEKAKVPRRQK